MEHRGSGRRNAAVLLTLLTGQLLLMSGSARDSRRAARVERAVMWVSSPVVRLAELVGGSAAGTLGALRELLLARGRSVVLEQNLQKLTEELQLHRETAEENRRLRRLLLMREEVAPDSIGARVITANLTGQTKMIVIDRGTKHGVAPDLPVLAWGGAVGRVVVCDASHAKVRLLNDPNSGVAAAVQRSRAQGIVFGTADGGLELRFVPRFSDVVHGDRVVTSGLAGIFPRGFGVGRVSSIRQAPDGTQTIGLDPEIDYRSLEEVLVALKEAGS